MPRARLLTPGPTEVPEPALLALARQVTHHRTEDSRQLLVEVLDGLKYVFQTRNDVVILTSSGTGAMEAAVVNLVPRGGKAIVLESGKFSERWSKLCETFGIEVVKYEVPWGQPFEPGPLAALVAQHPDAVAVYSTLSETSTGVGHDIEALGRVVKAAGKLLVVDGISGVGVMECRTDAWGIDVLAVGAQKALMGLPGLAFLAVSPAAWRQIETVPPGAFYFDLRAYRKTLEKPDTPYTPAKSLIVALAESLRQMRDEGMETIWVRGRLLSQAMHAGLAALGIRLVAARPADGLTAAYFPEGVDGKAFMSHLEQRFGIKLANGQGHLRGHAFRVAHMGLVDEVDVLGVLSAIELTLVHLGQSVKLGAGVAAASTRLAAERGLA